MATETNRAEADIALARLREIIARLDHATLGLLIEAAIEEADSREGDPDLEPNGDEEDGTRAEDEAGFFHHDIGPGCPISDPDYGADGS